MFQGPGWHVLDNSGRWSNGWDVQGSKSRSTKTRSNLSNSWRMKASRSSRLAGYWSSDFQFFECNGNVFSQPPLSQRGTSGKQQIKLPTADKTYVPDVDACVVACGGGLPRGCRFQVFRYHPQRLTKRHPTIGHHRNYGSPFLYKKPQVSGGGRDMQRTGSKAYSLYIRHSS